ncbi:MAG: alpha/beta hydrolase [Dehalococcoidia bacterium]
MPIRRGFIDTPNGQIHFRELGSGPPLVLLHEVARSSDGFSEVLPLLAQRSRCLAMDVPGYGDSYHPAAYPGIEGYARSVIDFLDALGIERTDLLGFHTGASIAAETAARYPERIAKLVVCGLPDVTDEERVKKIGGLHATVPDAEFRYLSELGPNLVHFAERYWGTDYAHRQGIDFLKAIPNTHWGHQAVYEQRVRERIPEISAPTLLFCASGDAFIRFQPDLAALFADVQTAVIAESEKFPLVNQPERSASLIRAFLDG